MTNAYQLALGVDVPKTTTVQAGRFQAGGPQFLVLAGGTAGQVLVTDGNSHLSWASVTASGTDAPSDGSVYGRLNGAWGKALPLAGGTLSGPLILAADPTVPLGAVTKQYADAHFFIDAPSDNSAYGRVNGAWGKVLPLAGGTLTGLLTLSGPPTVALHAATKAYVDALPNQALTFSGDVTGTGTAAITMTVTGLQGRTVAATAPTGSQVLQWSGSAWAPTTLPASGSKVTTDDVAPATPADGDCWWDSVSGQLYVFYDDPSADPGQWVAASNMPGPQGPAGAAGPSGAPGPAGSYQAGSGIAINTGTTPATISTAVPYLPLTGGQLYNPGANDPLNLLADAGHFSRVLYTVASTRTWSAGTHSDGHFTIADETAPAEWFKISTAGLLTANGNVNILGALQLAGGNFAFQDATYHYLNDKSGNAAVIMGGTASQSNIYRNTTHTFQSIGGAVTFAAIGDFGQSTYLNLNGAVSALGFRARAGTPGPVRNNIFNIDWTGIAELWIDNVKQGQIAYVCDYRIKDNVVSLGSTWDQVKALRPISYSYKACPELLREIADPAERWGFLAHELQDTLLPTAASGEKDVPNEVQSPDLVAICAALTSALQEAMARIEALEAGR